MSVGRAMHTNEGRGRRTAMTASDGGRRSARGFGLRATALRATVAATATVLALLVPAAPGSAAPLPQNWEAGPSLPASFTPRRDFAYAEFPPTGKVVLFGGA